MLAALKAQVSKKRRELEESGVLEEGRSYFKRSKLEEEEPVESSAPSGAPAGASMERGCRNNPGEGEGGAVEEKEEVAVELGRVEVVKRLREREEPVRLFGETDSDAFKRLRRLEISEPEINKGFRNDFQEAMHNVDKAYLQELLKYEGKEGSSSKDVKLIKAQLTMKDIIELNQSLERKMNEASAGNDNKKEILEMQCDLIMEFVELMLTEWGKKLNARRDALKMSVNGKRDAATYNQTRCYLKPLTKSLKKRTLSEDILESLLEIVQHCLDRNYVRANDAYLQMAIGNAPWPIGVTMVGIHARTGREKIYSKHVAHVLNDETQRKYIQGLKRCMTKCQEYYVADPSRCVEYNAVRERQ